MDIGFQSNLTSLPESIGNLVNLTRLDLYNNTLVSLPESISNLKNLTSLLLQSNKEDNSEEQFLIPDLLSKEEPATGEWNDTLAFQYHYNVLPGSIISRFIVKMGHYADKKTWWRNGIVLKRENNRALVKSDREDKKIFIWIDGFPYTRRDMLAIIRSNFDAIHNTITGIIAEEKVPLPGHPELVIDHADLKRMAVKGRETFYVPKLDTEFNVREALGWIEAPIEQTEMGEIEVPIEQTEMGGIEPNVNEINKEQKGMKNWWNNLDPNAKRYIPYSARQDVVLRKSSKIRI